MSDDDALGEVYAAILDRAPEHDFDPTLDRVREVCDLLGDPQHNYRVVHITGTNGKTSTARMVERLVREHGLRTGLFTSPHLTSVTERIAVDGVPVTPERFVELWQDVSPYIQMVDQRSQAAGGPRMSFFEVLTVMALAAFADAPVDVAVIEVGMGGTWDATNVVEADVAVITPVSLDHQAWLGDDLRDIAGEKSGIIKEHTELVLGEQEPDVDGVVLAAAAELGVRVVREGVDLEVADRLVAVGGQVIGLSTTGGRYPQMLLPLHGAHQAHNALLALAAVELLLRGGGALDSTVVESAFADADSPGRLESVRTSPTVLVDVAHNPSGAAALVAAVQEAFTFDRLVGVVGILQDKDAEQVLGVLEPLLTDVVITRSGSPRARDVGELAEIAVEVFGPDRVHARERLDAAITLAVDLAETGGASVAGVLVTGSVTVVAEARVLLGRRGARS